MIDSFRGKHRFLSNFYPCHINDGGDFPTVEHAYQAAKTLDEKQRLEIALAATAGEAKRLGRRATLRPNWTDRVKVGVMRGLLRQKFQAPELRKSLLDTGDEKLVEGNNWGDTFWGICGGSGQNWLGRLLMEVRAELKEEDPR